MPDSRIGTDWITGKQAAEIHDCHAGTWRNAAAKRGFTIKSTRRLGRVTFLYLRSEVEDAIGTVRARTKAKMIVKNGCGDTIRALVKWADSLSEWPTDEEIEAHTTMIYRAKDVRGVIDERIFRLKDPKPIDKTKDKYLSALRKPAMVCVKVRTE